MIGTAPFFGDVASAPDGANSHWLGTSDGTRIRAVSWNRGDRGTVFVFPGRTEYAEKYGKTVGNLVDRGFSSLVVDWRGQGLSDRHPNAPLLGYVEDFRDYQKDAAALLHAAEDLALPRPFYLMAHSMGGCIGLRTVLERSDFSAAIMSAPMWHLQMRAATRELTGKMTKLANVLGLGGRLTPGTSAEPAALSAGFEDNALTFDRSMFEWAANQIRQHRELSLGGPSIQWTYAALEEMARLYVAPVPSIPFMVFLGENEEVVSSSVIRSQVGKMAAGTLVEIEGCRHEVFMETPRVQDLIWQKIDDFMAALEQRPSRAPMRATGLT